MSLKAFQDLVTSALKAKWIAYLVIGLVIIICVIAGIVSQKFLGPDNMIEKISERIIEKETGISINLDLPPEKKL